jgi:hypothetical protein
MLVANRFAVAPIPTTMKMTFDNYILADNANKWQWGVQDKITFVSDGGALKGVYVSEQIKKEKGGGGFKDAPLDTSEANWEEIAGATHYDKIGPTAPPNKFTRAKALAALQADADRCLANGGNPDVSYANLYQIERYYSSAVDKKPAKLTDAHIVKKSGFSLQYMLVAFKAGEEYVRVKRKPDAVLGADPGVVDQEWIDANYAFYVPLE